LSLALLVQFCDLLLHHGNPTLLWDDELWSLILWGLENDERGLERRRALHLLEAILSQWSNDNEKNGPVVQQSVWVTYVKMYRTVEDTSLHLFTESWNDGIDILHPLQGSGRPALPLPWMTLLWKKALLHRHTGCQKLAALSFLKRNWFSDDQVLLKPTFATGVLAKALGQPVMERGMHSEEIRRGIDSFFNSWGKGPVIDSIEVLLEILQFAGDKKNQNHAMLSFLITAAEAVVTGMSEKIKGAAAFRIEEPVSRKIFEAIAAVVAIQPGYGANAVALQVYDSMVKISIAIFAATQDWYDVLDSLLCSLVSWLETIPLPLLQPPSGRLHTMLTKFFEDHFAGNGDKIAILRNSVHAAAKICGSSRQKVLLALLTAKVLGRDGLEAAFPYELFSQQNASIEFLSELIKAATPLPGNDLVSSTFNDWVAHRLKYYTAKDAKHTESKLEMWAHEASSWLIEDLLMPASKGEETPMLVGLVEICLKYSLDHHGSAKALESKDEALPLDFLERRNQACNALECVASAYYFHAQYMCQNTIIDVEQESRSVLLSTEWEILTKFVLHCGMVYLDLARRITGALSDICETSEIEWTWQRIRKEVAIAVLRPLITCIRVACTHGMASEWCMDDALTSLIDGLVQGIGERTSMSIVLDSTRVDRKKKKPGKLAPLTLDAWHHLLTWRCLDAALEESASSQIPPPTLALVYVTALTTLTKVAADQQNNNSVIPCIRCLRWLMPRMLAVADDVAHIICTPFTTLESTSSGANTIVRITGEVLLSVLTSSARKRTGLMAAILATALHPILFRSADVECNEEEWSKSLHAAPDGAVHGIVSRLRELSRSHAKLLLPMSTHLTALLAAYPRVGPHYADILVELTFAGFHDEDSLLALQEATLDEPSARELAALMGPVDQAVMDRYGTSSVAPRIGVLCLMHHWVCKGDSHKAAKAVWDRLFWLATVGDEDLVTEKYVYTGFIHRRKLRAWQALATLSPCLDAEAATSVLKIMLDALGIFNAANVKHLQEVVALQAISMAPEECLTQQLIPRLESSMNHQRAEAVPSLIVLAAVTVLQLIKDPAKAKDKVRRLIRTILPWCGSFVHANRTHAQLVLWRLLELYPTDTIHSSLDDHSLSIFDALREFYTVNADLNRLRKSIGVANHGLDTFDLKFATSPQGVLCGLQVSLLGCAGTGNEAGNALESAPVSLLEQVQQYLETERVALRKSLAVQMQEARDYEDARRGIEKVTGKEDLDDGVVSNDALAYQRKITPLEKETKVVDPWAFISNGSIAKRQGLVVVASLIDRIPNLAGLARTCEVFRAESLVLGDTSVIKDPEFEAISVSAEHWVPIQQVAPEALVSWLRRKRMEGFTLVGLEQTANAVKLPCFRFPRERVLLILGAEKEGIPAEVLQHLHATIEIPQLGVVRSLNVHVSAALALYEFTCQRESVDRFG
jgi:tRNA G18 (ribose-2'-O)-methylase SpoU